MGEIKRLLQDRFETRRSQLPARVTSIPLDADGKGLGYVLAEIAGNTGVRVRIGPSDTYYPGDWLAAEQIGGGAGAQYVARGYVPGSRPQSGVWEITTPTTIGTEVFDAGDVVHGNPYDTHWWYDYSAGRWYVRQGSTTHGALGFLADTYDYAVDSPAVGFAFGDAAETWLSGDDVNGLRIFSGSTQRVALNPDGSGWFVDPDVFSWDTSGNLSLSGNFQANSLRIGERAAGPAIRGGEVIEFDALGDPITEVATRYGLRIYDETGLPKIALLTGTLDNPDVPAALFGAEGDPNYLWYKNGALRLKGQAIIDGGQLGGFVVTDKRITSANDRIILVNENDADYAEGLLLSTGDSATAGTLAWRKSTAAGHEDDYAGILTTVYNTLPVDAFAAGATLLLGVSDLFSPWSSGAASRLRCEASTPTGGGQKAYLELGKERTGPYEWDEELWLETNAEVRALGGLRTDTIQPVEGSSAVQIGGLTGKTWLGPGEFVYVTQLGTAGRLATTGSGLQCVPSAYDMWFKLAVPAELAQAPVVTLQQLTIHYKTLISGAYIASVQIVRQNMTTDDVTVVAGYGSHLGEGTTGYGSQALLAEGGAALAGLSYPHLVKVTLGGVSDYGHVVIYGLLAEWSA